mmetsp:Transcript_48036/g.147940  ORF Transcript_48036/g.147940 Transcript_48036/m.147940 type:complete len:408 (+) Transcript_48036:303-1526(+)
MLAVRLVHQLFERRHQLLVERAPLLQHEARHRRHLRRRASAAPAALAPRARQLARLWPDRHDHHQAVEHRPLLEQRVLDLAHAHAAGAGRRLATGRALVVGAAAEHQLVVAADDGDGPVPPPLREVAEREGALALAVDQVLWPVGARVELVVAAPAGGAQLVDPAPHRPRHRGPRPAAHEHARLGAVLARGVEARARSTRPPRPQQRRRADLAQRGAGEGTGGVVASGHALAGPPAPLAPLRGRSVGHPHRCVDPRQLSHPRVGAHRLLRVAVSWREDHHAVLRRPIRVDVVRGERLHRQLVRRGGERLAARDADAQMCRARLPPALAAAESALEHRRRSDEAGHARVRHHGGEGRRRQLVPRAEHGRAAAAERAGDGVRLAGDPRGRRAHEYHIRAAPHVEHRLHG